MFLSRVENHCFLLFVFVFQAIFILILYRGGPSNVFRGLLESPQVVDYSKPHDVYTNLSFFTRAPREDTMPFCSAQSPVLGRYEPSNTVKRCFERTSLVRQNPERVINVNCVFLKLFHSETGTLMYLKWQNFLVLTDFLLFAMWGEVFYWPTNFQY